MFSVEPFPGNVENPSPLSPAVAFVRRHFSLMPAITYTKCRLCRLISDSTPPYSMKNDWKKLDFTRPGHLQSRTENVADLFTAFVFDRFQATKRRPRVLPRPLRYTTPVTPGNWPFSLRILLGKMEITEGIARTPRNHYRKACEFSSPVPHFTY